MAYNFMGNDHSNEFDTQDIADNKVVSVLAYIPILFWLPLVACGTSKFGKFHANQGLNLLLTNIVLGIAGGIIAGIFALIPFIGAFLAAIINFVVWAAPLGLMIYGMVNTGQGKAKELPAVGGLFTLLK
ncbi:MAG: DUF4870 domain-containing protein [Oscillospiraceae bacterium]|nr:DUF4870 domain-containing protein [Oscillospiraceae bacterium]